MPEHSGELPDNVEDLKALTLAISARADHSEADVETARSDVLRLKSEVSDLAQSNAMAKAEIARLTSILKTLRRERFGKRSEKLSADEAEQQSFAFEEVETGLEAIAARLAARSKGQSRKSGDKPRFSSHRERVEEIIEPEVPAGLQDKERVRIGQDESVRLDVIRARFRLIVTIRPKYRARAVPRKAVGSSDARARPAWTRPPESLSAVRPTRRTSASAERPARI